MNVNSKNHSTATGKKDPVITVYDTIYLIILILAFVIVTVSILTDKNVPAMDSEIFSEDWYYDAALTRIADLKHPGELDEYKAGNTIHYYTKVPPSAENGDGIMFKAKNCTASVYIGDESQSRADYNSYGTIYGKSFGTDWVEFPVFAADAGKLIHIEFTPCYNDTSCYLGSFSIGSYRDVITGTMSGLLSAAIVSILIFCVGIILIIVFLTLKKATRINEMDLFYLGLIAISFSVWTFSETKIMQFFTHNTGAVHIFNCMTLTLIPMPVILFFQKSGNKRQQMFIKIIAGICILNSVCSVILHYSGIADFHETLRMTHVAIILSAATTLYVNIYRYFHMEKPDKRAIASIAGLIIISIFGVIDIIRYNSGGSKDSSQFTRIAILLYIVSLGITSLEHAALMIKKGMTSELVSRLAYEDGLTGLGNRTAYNEMLASIAEKNREHSVFMFDINNLKYVNDNLGHAAGDRLITAAADVIQKNFGSIGRCYRIGGDEFICISDQPQNVDKILTEFFSEIDQYNMENSHEFPLVIAVGASLCEKNKDIYYAVEFADKKMYECKTELKKKYPLEKLIASL